jgi:hypothetical protein
MDLQKESYLQAYRRQEQLAGIENQWQIDDLLRSQKQPSILDKAKAWFRRSPQECQSGLNPSLETN